VSRDAPDVDPTPVLTALTGIADFSELVDPDHEPPADGAGPGDGHRAAPPPFRPTSHPVRRESKWDRPPEPHDWRFYVGTIGKILIATGLLMFGFVAYQLWGTGIETARAQSSLELQFEQIVAADRATTVPDSVTSPTSTAPIAGEVTVPGGTAATSPTTSLPPATTTTAGSGSVAPADLSGQAVIQNIPAIDRGDVIARLQIPRIGKDLYVVAGVSLTDLKDGPGHYPDTPLPGQLGNAAIAGHRTTYGAPFFDVDQLAAGDELIVTMITGDQFVYVVTGVEVVSASDYWVVTTRDPDIAELTLTSCHPKYTARDRIVVHSVLDPSRSANVGVPTFYGLDGDPVESPTGDDPVVTQPAPAGGVVSQPDDVTGSTPPAPTTAPPATSVPAATSPSAAAPDDSVDDAFVQGWFDDRGAFVQLALWGTLLALVAVLAYAVSRRSRHDSIGLLVGIVPFVVVLYFFFQNVNRLLPPGI
jgi:sortase A